MTILYLCSQSGLSADHFRCYRKLVAFSESGIQDDGLRNMILEQCRNIELGDNPVEISYRINTHLESCERCRLEYEDLGECKVEEVLRGIYMFRWPEKDDARSAA